MIFMIYGFENLCYTHEESRNTDTPMEKQFIDQISSALGFFSRTQNGYKFQCPYCQHGNKNQKGKPLTLRDLKGSLYRSGYGNEWKFKCFRCREHKSFHYFLEDHFPEQFVAYVRQRDAQGTTGKHTNCPKLETVLKRQGVLPEGAPEFHKHRPLPPTRKPQEDAVERLQQPPQVTVTPAPPSVTKLPPMKSPQQQAGCQARINHEIKQREKRRRERSGELW